MIVWDERKRQTNLAKHGLDFADAYLVYDNPDKVTFSSPRFGEDRKLDIAIVEAEGRFLTLVYVVRGDNVRLISFRASSRIERREYEWHKKSD
ncbi:hypothetical protein HNQ77_003763 [Silvibacterium bohemicum]|uniref:BrnT family toxin n=1 Tax=Silvibacterium bohemicum TaxID=1577686 RepID=A0A841JWQ5_9BACT|nr:BrnT family toxin [Silvibacterium bohemicum]MBB6145802.1 hypothetical protein [Silvibacterium bohemicum]